MTRVRLLPSPLLQAQTPLAVDDFDAVIKKIWAMYLTNDITWRGAGRLHDAVCDLRDRERAAA